MTTQLMNPFQAFRLAKDSFAQLHPFSQPHSLVRRGDTLIARYSYSVPGAFVLDAWYIEDEWADLIHRILPEASILSVSFDRRTRTVRARFQLIDDDFYNFLRETRD